MPVSVTRRAVLAGCVAVGAAASSEAAIQRQWSEAGLDAFRRRALEEGFKALLVVTDGHPVLSAGDVAAPDNVGSVRKSFLSALYGTAWGRGQVKLDATLAELGIDDYSPLTDVEKQATVRHLLQARSGVYLPSSIGSPDQIANLPGRGSHPPGTHWYYSNWDFNALGEIYQRVTGRGLFAAFEHELARPLGFQDFDPLAHAYWDYQAAAPRFGAYRFRLSARDMAKFGQLYLDHGAWKGAQLVPAAWVDESVRRWTVRTGGGVVGGYGYMWWVHAPTERAPLLRAGGFSAVGNPGRFITVLPYARTVVVLQNGRMRTPSEFGRAHEGLLQLLLQARTA